jgi:multicomponent Na+:H+ antiporter subunit E
MSRVSLGACLVVLWVLMWGDLSVGTVLGGSAVALSLFVVFPSRRHLRPRIAPRPVAVARLVGYFVWELVVSNLMLSRELLRRRTSIRSRVIAVPMRTTSPSVLTMVTNLAALAPGTMVVDALEADADHPTAVLTLHVLVFDDDADENAPVRALLELEARAARAFGSPEALAEIAAAEGLMS